MLTLWCWHFVEWLLLTCELEQCHIAKKVKVKVKVVVKLVFKIQFASPTERDGCDAKLVTITV